MKFILRGCMLLFTLAFSTYAATASSTQAKDSSSFVSTEVEIVSIDELENARGRQGIDITTINNMNVKGILTDNTANNNVTGTNFIDNGSFTGASGMFSVIQNTGNNVLIQDVTNVTVTIVP